MSFSSVNPRSIAKFNSATSSEFLDGLERHIDSTISLKNSEPSRKTFAPSSFKCDRAMWFRLRGTQPDKVSNPDRVLNFKADLGTACHEILQQYISDHLGSSWIDYEAYVESNSERVLLKDQRCEKKGFETLVESNSPYPIRFACDGIVKLNDTYYLLEIKTCEADVFRDLTDPRPKHIDQAMCYATILGLDKVLFLYLDRSWGDMKCYELNVSKADRENVIRKFDLVMHAVDTNLAPDPLPNKSEECSPNTCKYYKVCKQW